MKILHRLIQLIVLVVLLSLGLAVFFAALSSERWNDVVILAENGRSLVILAGLGFFFLAILFAVTGLRRKNREKFLSFENEGGKVNISTDAISDYISKLMSEFPSILRLKPEVVPYRDSVDIVISVRIKAGPDIHEVCEVLQKRVRETMDNGLGISEIRNIEVTVKEIVSGHKPE